MTDSVDSAFDRTGLDLFGHRGSNQSGMRAHNERLVLSLVRQKGALAKAELAKISGLSAQTVSVIMRELERDGLLVRGEPLRGRIGQPSVPMSLALDGAYFFGLKIGRRSIDLILIDFLGNLISICRQTYLYPTPSAVIDFVSTAIPKLRAHLSPQSQNRISGMGVAMPFHLWNWALLVGAPDDDMQSWRHRNIQAEIAQISGLPVYIQNDATAACGAELVFGNHEGLNDFLYFFLGHFIGGGLVLNGQLYSGRTGNAAALGSMPVPDHKGKMCQLIHVASLATLESEVIKAGEDAQHMWSRPINWTIADDVFERWVDDAAYGIAYATLSASAVIDFGTVLIDGWLPNDRRDMLVERVQHFIKKIDFLGLEAPQVKAGSVGLDARTLGAASIPLSQRYLLDPSSLLLGV